MPTTKNILISAGVIAVLGGGLTLSTLNSSSAVPTENSFVYHYQKVDDHTVREIEVVTRVQDLDITALKDQVNKMDATFKSRVTPAVANSLQESFINKIVGAKEAGVQDAVTAVVELDKQVKEVEALQANEVKP